MINREENARRNYRENGGADLSILLDLPLGDDDQGREPERSRGAARGGEGGAPRQRGGARRRRHCSVCVCVRAAATAFVSYPLGDWIWCYRPGPLAYGLV
jgi:hypothetical protein